VKPGALVRYAIFPHEELHFSGMTGVVLNRPHVKEWLYGDLVVVDVMWSEDRPQAEGELNIEWEYIDRLEVV
jgi:hypothetical protein